MNLEIEEAKKKIGDGVVAYLRAAYKASGSVDIAVLMLAKDLPHMIDSYKESDFEWLETEGSNQ